MLRAAARARRLPPRLTPSRRGNRPAAASPARKGYAAAPEARPSPPLCAGHFRPRAHRPSASDVAAPKGTGLGAAPRRLALRPGDRFACGTAAPPQDGGGALGAGLRLVGGAARGRARGRCGAAPPLGRSAELFGLGRCVLCSAAAPAGLRAPGVSGGASRPAREAARPCA